MLFDLPARLGAGISRLSPTEGQNVQNADAFLQIEPAQILRAGIWHMRNDPGPGIRLLGDHSAVDLF